MFSKTICSVLAGIYLICTLLQLAGFITPAWVVSDLQHEFYQSNGLWYSVSCREGYGCELKSYYDFHKGDKTGEADVVYANQVGEEVIATISVTAALVSCVLCFVNICGKQRRPTLSILIVLLTYISASLIWTIIGSTVTTTTTEHTKTYKFPYSLFCSALGSVGSLILATIYLVKILKVTNSITVTYRPLV